MKIFKTVLMVCFLSLAFNVSLIFPQSAKKSKDKSVSTRTKDKRTNSKTVKPGDYFPENEIESPFRYVIIDDDVQFGVREEEQKEVPVRRFVKVLMDERAFNEANLAYLFKYLSNYYANPLYLGIEVHTNLMTLETLEESLAMSTHSSRDDFRQFYKTASYSRFNDGSEGFLYYTGKSGEFIMKFVNLPKTTKK
jgi:hypothetical protein